ncbi:MAG: cysteine--tRNA ligase [Chitinispirillia bacterium]|nr:cysteine--tRNA ligase [Chitinispirillia bacterium]
MRKHINLYNTATARKEKFVPQHERVGMYCCGPTVYNYAHIGNLRTYIFEDVLKRALIACGYDVKHIVNITDVGHLVSDADTGEDKMETGAAREGKSVWDIAKFYTEKFMADISSLNILQPDVWPKATDYIPQMIGIVKSLEEKGFTYRTGDGIYFDTAKFPTYCDFARIDPETLRAGERVDMGDKRNVTDFALWKFSPKDAKRQMEWESPWGTGFPGWHIECSAMSLAHLPQPVDIHCGGMDHIRVHHTNEIAQTEAATGEKFANFWLHGEFLVLDKGKMAKSGGNFVTLDTLRDKGVSPLGYRMFCYTAHYRSPLTFSFEGAASAEQGLTNLRRIISTLSDGSGRAGVDKGRLAEISGPFMDALCDDLNMPRAMAALWEGLRDNKLTDGEKLALAEEADKVLGLDLMKPAENRRTEITEEVDGYKIFLSVNGNISPTLKNTIIEKAVLRKKSRAAKDFKTADLIRDRFAGAGVAVKDLPDGTTECVVEDLGRAEGAL